MVERCGDRPLGGARRAVVQIVGEAAVEVVRSRSCRPLLGVVRTVVGVERGSERARRVMESGAGRPDRDAEDVGDLGERQAVVVLEHEDRALVGRQAAEAAFELVAVGDRPKSSGPRARDRDPRRRRRAGGERRGPPRRSRRACATLARTITR